MREILQNVIRRIQENGDQEFWFREESINELLEKAHVQVETDNLIIEVEGCIIKVSSGSGKLFNIHGGKTETCFYRLNSIKGLYDIDSKERHRATIL